MLLQGSTWRSRQGKGEEIETSKGQGHLCVQRKNSPMGGKKRTVVNMWGTKRIN